MERCPWRSRNGGPAAGRAEEPERSSATGAGGGRRLGERPSKGRERPPARYQEQGGVRRDQGGGRRRPAGPHSRGGEFRLDHPDRRWRVPREGGARPAVPRRRRHQRERARHLLPGRHPGERGVLRRTAAWAKGAVVRWLDERVVGEDRPPGRGAEAVATASTVNSQRDLPRRRRSVQRGGYR